MAGRSPRFQLRPGSALDWRHWGDENVVFDPASGATHVLDAVSSQGLRCLGEQPCDISELTAAMARTLDLPVDEVLEAYVDRLLVQFAELGLIEAIGE